MIFKFIIMTVFVSIL